MSEQRRKNKAKGAPGADNRTLPCPECGSANWVPEMGFGPCLRHFKGCSDWSAYFDGGERPNKALEGKK